MLEFPRTPSTRVGRRDAHFTCAVSFRKSFHQKPAGYGLGGRTMPAFPGVGKVEAESAERRGGRDRGYRFDATKFRTSSLKTWGASSVTW